jgi:hypothetical protein
MSNCELNTHADTFCIGKGLFILHTELNTRAEVKGFSKS